MTVMQVAEWCPDRPDLADATSIAQNVIALTPESYGPVASLVHFASAALPQNVLGMGFAQDSALVPHIFAGLTSALYIINGGSNVWTDVSGTAYTPTAGESWNFAQYNDLMLATFWGNPVQSYNMISGGTFADLTPGPFDTGNNQAAPQARYMAVAKTFVILANTHDAVGGNGPSRVWWSAAGAPAGVVSGGKTGWPVPGSTLAQQTQSDFTDLTGPMGAIVGLAPNLAGCDCAVFFQHGVQRMIYVGPPDIFDFYPAAAVRGSIAPNSLVSLGMQVYYLGEDGFYVFDGNASTPIGANKVDKWFFANADLSVPSLIVGAADIANKAICWTFRSNFSANGLADFMLIYRWDIQRWSYALLATHWISRVVLTEPFLGLAAGELQLAAISGGSFLSLFTGPSTPAQVGTKVVQITPGGRTWVNHSRPLIDSTSSGVNILTEDSMVLLTENGLPLITEASGTVITVAMSARNTYYEAEVFGPEVAPDVSGDCGQRSDGRYHRGRISTSGIWTTMFGLDVVGARAGMR